MNVILHSYTMTQHSQLKVGVSCSYKVFFKMSRSAVSLDSILLANWGPILTKEDLRCPVRKPHLSRIAIRIGDWKSCASLLGFDQDLIQDIDDEEKTSKRKRIRVLSNWQERHGKDATYLRLAEVFEDLERRDLIELLISEYLSIPAEKKWIDIENIKEKCTIAVSVCKGKSAMAIAI